VKRREEEYREMGDSRIQYKCGTMISGTPRLTCPTSDKAIL
jgi:hypothetical protein